MSYSKPKSRWLVLPLITVSFTLGLFACGTSGSGRTCAGADELNAVVVNLAQRGSPGGGAPSSSGARSSGSSGVSSRGGSPAPSNSGARAGSKAGAPANSGARSAPSAEPTISGGKVPSYSGSSSIGRSYSYGGRVYVYHSPSYYHSAPDPYDPFDSRNFSNPFSPYFGEHLRVAC